MPSWIRTGGTATWSSAGTNPITRIPSPWSPRATRAHAAPGSPRATSIPSEPITASSESARRGMGATDTLRLRLKPGNGTLPTAYLFASAVVLRDVRELRHGNLGQEHRVGHLAVRRDPAEIEPVDRGD